MAGNVGIERSDKKNPGSLAWVLPKTYLSLPKFLSPPACR